MKNFTDCEMKEATFLQEVVYVGLKCLGFVHFTQNKHFRLERFPFPLALRNSGSIVISVTMVTCSVVLDCMENKARSTSFTRSSAFRAEAAARLTVSRLLSFWRERVGTCTSLPAKF